MRYEFCEFENLKYIVRYPRGYVEGEKYPVLIFLHGGGTRGNDHEMLKENSFFSITEALEDFPFVTVAPQCCAKTWYDVYERLKKLISHTCNEPYTDKSRVYVMGTSLGGYATWQIGISMPEFLAAVVPICGGGMRAMTSEMVNVPVWAFHGDLDDAVFVEESKFMVDALNEMGGNAKLKIYEGEDHCIWEQTYADPEVYKWLLKHKNENAKEIPDLYNDMSLYG